LSKFKVKHTHLAGWYAEALGQELAEAEQAYINTFLPDLFGYHLLQIGNNKSLRWLKESRIRHHVGISPDSKMSHHGSWVRGWIDNLPFRPDSLDVIVLPHTLEYCSDPQLVLQEAAQALLPEGNMIILGFNPYSLWGIRRLFRSRDGSFPWRGNFLSAGRIQQWLAELGCVTVRCETLFYRPPINNEFWLKHLHYLEKFGKKIYPNCGAVFVLQVKKQSITLTPIKKRWSLERIFDTSRLAEPTTRTHKVRTSYD
jgi:SAM-dependent methyltransferase